MFKPADLLTLSKRAVRRDTGRLTRVKNQIGKAQANACDEDSGDRNEGNESVSGSETGANNNPFVTAEKLIDPCQGSRINIPCVPPDVCDPFDTTIVRRVKAVIHAGSQPQRDIAAVVIGFCQGAVAE